MATDADVILHRVIERQLKAGKFSSTSAADAALAPIARLDNLKPLDIPNLRPILLDGLKVRAKQYQPAIEEVARNRTRDEEDGQGDLGQLSADFMRALYAPAALDELEGTVRLPPIDMNLEQLRLHIALKRRKAGQTWRTADMLDRVINRHLNEWGDAPKKTLREIIAGAEGAAVA